MTRYPRIRITRHAKKLTQAEVAGQVGVSLNTFQRYEDGIRIPQADVAARLAKVLGVSMDYLFADAPENTDIANALIEGMRELIEQIYRP